MKTITLTFAERAENHKGMQIIGNSVDKGLSIDTIKNISKMWSSLGAKTELIDLNSYLPDDKLDTPPASILIIKNGLNIISKELSEQLAQEQFNLVYDTKALMYGRVVNKHARHNLCFSDFSQKADIANGKGTIYDFKDLPNLSQLRKFLMKQLEGITLQCESNLYYDTKKCYIGFHGDTERKIVIGVRIGDKFPLYYQWYYKSQPVGKLCSISLENGDIYYMSEKAVGFDWHKKNILTLRHAAGEKALKN